MKKVLFGTTALVGAALIASAASAESPKVTVGGFMDWQAGWANDDKDSPAIGSGQQRHYGFRNDTEISFKIDGVAESGLKYGGEISLEADVDSEGGLDGYADADGQGINSSKTFLYLEGSWGRFEAGSNIGADQTLKVDASSIARASGGIDGAFTYFNNGGNGVGAATGGWIVTPDLPMNYGAVLVNAGQGDEFYENANKVTYYTPRWQGLQAGVSFAPDQVDRGQLMSRIKDGSATNPASNAFGTIPDNYGDIWQGGVNYDNTFNGWGIGLAATGEWANADTKAGGAAAQLDDLRAYALGGKVSYMGFSVAASYGNNGGSNYLKSSNVNSDFWTVGGAYEWGPFGASVTYLNSDVDATGAANHRFDNLSVGADWKLAPGFTPYIEADWFKYNANAGVLDNTGTVVLVGSQLAF